MTLVGLGLFIFTAPSLGDPFRLFGVPQWNVLIPRGEILIILCGLGVATS